MNKVFIFKIRHNCASTFLKHFNFTHSNSLFAFAFINLFFIFFVIKNLLPMIFTAGRVSKMFGYGVNTKALTSYPKSKTKAKYCFYTKSNHHIEL